MASKPSLLETRHKKMALFIALAFPVAASAQAPAEQQMAEVVVSATGFEQDIKQAPASISVITREELETKQYRDLAEALSGIEGIDVLGSTGKTGGLSISMRGMPSDYSLILIDGRRQNPPGDVTPNGFGSALNSFMPPVSAIERIEVIRGPMSTLYGADAMGGVINIITRKVAKEWGGTVSVEAGLPENRDFGDTYKLNLYATGPIVEDTLGIAIRGSVFRRGDSERINNIATGRDPAPAKSDQHNFGTRLTLTPGQGQEFWLDLDHAYTWYDNEDCRLGSRDGLNRGDCLTPDSTVYPGYKDHMTLTRQQATVGHKARLDVGVLESSLMHSTTETKGRTHPGDAYQDPNHPAIGTDRELKATSVVLDSKLIAPIGDNHVATVGGQWWDAKLVDGLLPQARHSQSMWSLFLEDEWRLTPDLTATLGARYDHHDAFGGHVSPRAYLVWNTTPNWTIKGGVSEGFRPPRINQLIDGISGITGQGEVFSIGNPNLKPETSRTTELGAIFDNLNGWVTSVTLFHNDFKDKIVNDRGSCETNPISSCSAVPDPNETDYAMNVDQAKTWGLELGTNVALAERWSLSMNYTWTDSELIERGRVTGKLTNAPKHMANAQLRWNTTEKLNLWLRGEYRGESRRFMQNELTAAADIAERNALGDKLKAYGLLHVGGSYKASKRVTLNATIFNLLDKEFNRFQTWSYPSGGRTATGWGNEYFRTGASISGAAHMGRTFWISANMDF